MNTLLDLHAALQLMRGHVKLAGVEEIDYRDAFGRVLAADLRADRDYPPFDRSMMDGFAVRSADLAANPRTQLQVVATVNAGDPAPQNAAAPGNCVRIMTGAPVPAGYDAVVRVEDSLEDDTQVNVRVRFECDAPSPGKNIARRGEDLRSGQTMVAQSHRVDHAVMGALATTGNVRPIVHRPPRTAILTTGDELVDPSHAPQDHQIRASNGVVLAAQLQRYGIAARLEHRGDDRTAIEAALRELLDPQGYGAELLLLTGGVSMGDRDFVPAALAAAGVRNVFHRINVKPGKPLWFGTGEHTAVFGLPGNPFSVQVGCRIFVESYLRAAYRLPEAQVLQWPLCGGRRKQGDRHEFFPCRPFPTASGAMQLIEVAVNGSGDVRAGLGSTGLALHPVGQAEIAAGAAVSYYPWEDSSF